MAVQEQLLQVVHRPIGSLKPDPRNARTHNRRQRRMLASSLRRFGFCNPILVDQAGQIIAGHCRWEAAKELAYETVPTITLSHLTKAERRGLLIADNKIAEKAGWDRELLADEVMKLLDDDFDVETLGFDPGEFDNLVTDFEDAKGDPADVFPAANGPIVSRPGDVWLLKQHRIACGDARSKRHVAMLMAGRSADMVFTDPPYNVTIAGHVGGRGQTRHAEFAFASGEMTQSQFREFLTTCLGHVAGVSRAGAVHFVCMDWRHIADLIGVGSLIYSAMLNLVVWKKGNSGQGSFYRSAHELIAVFRAGAAAHQNNVELGKHGRNRSNVWDYPGVNSFGAGRDDALAMHPTVKPVAMVADAMRDCTTKGDIVLDTFLGSGTTLIAAEKVGRQCFGLEYEPAYVDCAIRRWQAMTKVDAVLEGDGRTFDELATMRASEFATALPLLLPKPAVDSCGDGPPDWTALCLPLPPEV